MSEKTNQSNNEELVIQDDNQVDLPDFLQSKSEEPKEAENVELAAEKPKNVEEPERSEVKSKLTPIEEEALSTGWNPEGEKSAEEWVRSAPLYQAITQRNKKIDQLERSLQELTKHMDQQREVGYKQALEDLQSRRRMAISDGDIEAVEELDTKIDEIKSFNQPSQPQDINNHPAVQSFAQRHASWVNDPSYEAEEMRTFARERAEILQNNYNMDIEQALVEVEKDLRYKYPDKFKNSRAEEPVKVDMSTTHPAPRANKKTVNISQLNPSQKMLYNWLKQENPDKAKKYIKDLIDAGAIDA